MTNPISLDKLHGPIVILKKGEKANESTDGKTHDGKTTAPSNSTANTLQDDPNNKTVKGKGTNARASYDINHKGKNDQLHRTDPEKGDEIQKTEGKVTFSEGERSSTKESLNSTAAKQAAFAKKKVKVKTSKKDEPQDRSQNSPNTDLSDKSPAEVARTAPSGNGINPSNAYDNLQKLINQNGGQGAGSTGNNANNPVFGGQPIPSTGTGTGTGAGQVGQPGQFRRPYNINPARDFSPGVINTIVGEAKVRGNNIAGIDAVINVALNRAGGRGYGRDLLEVFRQPGQFTGYRQATQAQRDLIVSRIQAIASGAVPDNTNGADQYRADWYVFGAGQGKTFYNIAKAQGFLNIGGNIFARVGSSYGPYASTPGQGGTSGGTTGGTGTTPGGTTPGSGGGGTTPSGTGSNPVINDLKSKIETFQGQKYFGPKDKLPTPPAGYEWVGNDHATLFEQKTNRPLTVEQTLSVFDWSWQDAQGTTPGTGGGGATPGTGGSGTTPGSDGTVMTPGTGGTGTTPGTGGGGTTPGTGGGGTTPSGTGGTGSGNSSTGGDGSNYARQRYGQAQRAIEAILRSIQGGYMSFVPSANAAEVGSRVPATSAGPNYNIPSWGGTTQSVMNGVSSFGQLTAQSNALLPTTQYSPLGNNFGISPVTLNNTGNLVPMNSNALGSNFDLGGINQSGPVASGNPIPLGGAGNFPSTTFSNVGNTELASQQAAAAGLGGGGGGSKGKKQEESEEKSPPDRPTEITKRLKRKGRTKDEKDDFDKKLDKTPSTHGERPYVVGGDLIKQLFNLEDMGKEDQEGRGNIGRFTDSLQNIPGGMPRDMMAQIPAMESLLMNLPNQAVGQFLSALPSQFQSFIPSGLIPGLTNNFPVSLNSLLQLAGGGALGGAAGQLLRSMTSGVPIASVATQAIQSIPLENVFGVNGNSLSPNVAGLANVLGIVSNVVLQQSSRGIPVSINSVNQAVTIALNSSLQSLSIPTQVLGIANQIASNPIGSILNIAMGNMLSNGSLPILPPNLSTANTALLSGLSQFVPPEIAQQLFNVGQITNMLPPNVKNLIPQVPPKMYGAPPNSVETNRRASPIKDNEANNSSPPKEKEASNDGKSSKDTRLIDYSQHISEHYTLGDVSVGVKVCKGHHVLEGYRVPIEKEIENLSLVAENILEPLRSQFPHFNINSGYRGKYRYDQKYKKTCGADPGSDHAYGRAVDLSWGGNDQHYQIAMWIKRNLNFKQCILEGSWIHISFEKGGNRRQCKTIGYGGSAPGFVGY